MFIAHGEKVRKHARWILAGVLVILVPGFVALFTTTGGRERREEDLPTLRGKPVNPAEFESARRAVRDQFFISTGREMPGTPDFQDQLRREAVTRLLLLRKANELGIRVSQATLEQSLTVHPAFRNEQGQFDANRYRQFMIMLNNRGIGEARFLEIMRENFIIGQLQDWVGASAKVTPQQVQLQYAPLHEKNTIELAQVEMSDNKDAITVTDADAEAYFNSHKDTFRKPALVKIRYAFFSNTDFQKKAAVPDADVEAYYDENRFRFPEAVLVTTNITGSVTNLVTGINSNALVTVKTNIRELLTGQQARRLAGEAAQTLAIKLVPEPNAPLPDFSKLATAAGAAVKETDFFSQNDTVPGVDGRDFYSTAFWLARRPDPPFSDAVESPEGCYVLQYLDGKPARIPAFTEVKQEVTDRLKNDRRYEATLKQGKEALDKVRQLVAGGQSFSNACAQLNLKTETYGPFTASDPQFPAPASGRIQQAVLSMTVNSLSEFITTATGGVFFQLKDRQPPDAAAFEADRVQITQQLIGRARNAAFQSWVQNLLRDEQVNFGKPRARPTPTPEPEEEEPIEPQPAPAQK